MKKYMGLIFVFTFFCSIFQFSHEANAEFRVEARPILGGGVRLGKGDELDRATRGYLLGKMSFLRWGDYHYVTFLNPGIGLQTDGRFHINLSPVTYSMNSGFTIGLDLMIPEKKNQSVLGMFLGYEFL